MSTRVLGALCIHVHNMVPLSPLPGNQYSYLAFYYMLSWDIVCLSLVSTLYFLCQFQFPSPHSRAIMDFLLDPLLEVLFRAKQHCPACHTVIHILPTSRCIITQTVITVLQGWMSLTYYVCTAQSWKNVHPSTTAGRSGSCCDVVCIYKICTVYEFSK